MSDNVQKISLNFKDRPKDNLADQLAGRPKQHVNTGPRMLGRVMVHEKTLGSKKHDKYVKLSEEHAGLYVPKSSVHTDPENTKIVDTSNLIVYRGRHMLLSRAFNKALNWNGSGSEQAVFDSMQDKFICWFGVGSGGSASNNSQSPLAVSATQWELGQHGYVDGDSAKYVTINGRQYHKFDTDFPDFVVDEEVSNNSLLSSQLENVTYNSKKRDTYLVAHIQVTLPTNEGNGPSGSQEINECGLFFANSNSISGDFSAYEDNNLHLECFAMVTFPTITKDNTREISFSWYIYF